MAQFKRYASTDGSAPTLSGTVGSLIALLDACLVTGYGAQTPAGWTKPYVGTNLAAFRQGGANQFYARINDAGPGAGGAKEARILGYETMSDVDTGTGPFPTAAQMANGLFVRKSTTADATARAWKVFADDRTVYGFVQTGDSAGVYLAFMFGDVYSVVTADAYRTLLISRATEDSATLTNDRLDLTTNSLQVLSGHYMARGHTGLGGAVNVGKISDYPKQDTANNFSGGVGFPNAGDSAIWIAPVWLCDPTTGGVKSIRGRLRGLYCWLHAIAGVSDGDTFSGAGDFAGKSFEIIKQGGGGGAFVLETSNTLDTN